MKTVFTIISLAISLVAASCAVDTLGVGNVTSNSSYIYGGKETSSDEFRAAVKIKLSENGKSFCTGSLVRPNLIITAAHCLQSGMGEWLELHGEVLIGNGVDEKNSISYKVKKAWPNPEFNNVLAKDTGDYGFIVLVENVPKNVARPIPTITEAELKQYVKVDTEVEIVGFGIRENKESGAKYKATIKVNEVHTTELEMGGDGIDTCTGDSGGPAYATLPNGELRVLGITSRSSSYRKSCGAGGFYTMANVAMDWVEKTLSEDAIDKSNYTFLDYCKNSEFGTNDANTVQTMKNAVKEENCDKAFELLKRKKTLTLANRRIKSVKPFAGLTSLESLNLYNNRIEYLDGLNGLRQLKILTLGRNEIRDVYQLRALTGLVRLSLKENSISDITCLNGLTLLRELNVSDNKIEFFAGIKLKKLRVLDASRNLVRDLDSFRDITNLEELRLFENGLYNLNGVKYLRGLKELYVSDNLIEDISEIAELSKTLDTLMLDNNRVTDIEALSNFVELKSLGLKDNGIRDLSPLATIKNIDFLTLYGNPVDKSDRKRCPRDSTNWLLNRFCEQ